MNMLEEIVDYLKRNELALATAESCTAGLVASELARIPGSGSCMDCGLAVYSPEAKNRYLKVSFDTIERYGLTSEAVAREMAMGALQRNSANVAVANTGLAGPGGSDDGTPVGTVCFAWAVRCGEHSNSSDYQYSDYEYSETRHFDGDRNQVRLAAAHYLLQQLPFYHRKAMDEHGRAQG